MIMQVHYSYFHPSSSPSKSPLLLQSPPQTMTLQEAIAADNVDTLYSLIERNKNLLDDAGPFTNTPLHNAAEKGKTKMAMEIATLKPSFTRKLNCRGYSPMHLALLNKHYHTARALMTLNPEVIQVRGRDGYTPLHFVAGEIMQDQEEVQELLAEILSTCKSSIEDLTNQCETAVHVAVKKGNTKALEILLGWLKRVRLTKILNWKDQNGNTVLHIAVSGQQQLQAGQQQLPMAISGQQQLLVQLPAAVSGQQQLPAAVSAAVSGQQQLLTAVSGQQQLPVAVSRQQQLQAGQQQLPVAVSGQQQLPVAVSKEQQLEIVNLLIGCTNVHAKNLQHKTALQICLEYPNRNQDVENRLRHREHQTRHSTPTLSLSQYFSMKLTVFERYAGYFGTRNEKVRNIVLIVSTLILTATYQSAFTPPGGYWQDSSSNNPANSTIVTPNSTVVTTNSSSIVTGKPHQAGNLSGVGLWYFTILNSFIFTASVGTVWATAITFFPDTLMVYTSLALLGDTYFVFIKMDIPNSEKLLKWILFGFYECSLQTMLLFPVYVWWKHNRVLSRIDARRGWVDGLLGSKDRK
ncbi:hypothetical protein ACJRO7_017794 [Eucalyptus globulus]|uniref:PGG domain-containing protein n=1 Tax=Eucalyptus globulus TaxID=34317 RepID=A0ABD3KRK2_EUCGL